MALSPLRYLFTLTKTFLVCLSVIFTLACTNDTTEDENDLDIVNPVEDAEDADDPGDPENPGDSEDPDNSDEPDESEDSESSCDDITKFVFVEKDGIVKVEFEDADFTGNWELKSNGSEISGEGYMSWKGAEYFNQPGNGKASYKIKIKNSGTYQFLWKSAVTLGNDGTEHNDTWLRFPDADNFFAEKGSSVVYPKGSGKSPHPEGASKDGWFKIYRSGNDLDFKWQAYTFDNNPHEVFVSFDEPGTYTMEISARSKGHGIDQFVLFQETLPKEEAVSDNTQNSNIICN